jgi:hypothetical protein
MKTKSKILMAIVVAFAVFKAVEVYDRRGWDWSYVRFEQWSEMEWFKQRMDDGWEPVCSMRQPNGDQVILIKRRIPWIEWVYLK